MYVTIADTDIGSLKSLHTLFDKYLGYMLVKFEQHRMVWSPKYWAFWQKMVNYFWQSADNILDDVSVTKIIVWCLTINLKTIIFQWSKTYGSLTRVTRLKVAPNMVDPISLNETRQ